MKTENEQGLLRRSDALTLEEIQASTDLSGKIASASALKGVNDKLGTFRQFRSVKIEAGGTVTIDGFVKNKGYLIVDVHINNGVAMYITSAGYDINMPLYHVAGNNKLTLISSTPLSITVQSTAISSLVILELGTWF